MAKTREQKQAEAIERKSALLPKYRERVLDTQAKLKRAEAALAAHKPRVSSDIYHGIRLGHECDIARTRHQEAVRSLHRLCAELKCDTSGNPVEKNRERN